MTTEDYVSFETAKLLKEKGFKGNGSHFYEKGRLVDFHNYWWRITMKERYEAIEAPTLQTAMKWLRKTHNIYIYATPWYHEEENPLKKGEYNLVFNGWGYNISNLATNTVIAESDEDNLYSTPEQACEIAIKYYLEKLW